MPATDAPTAPETRQNTGRQPLTGLVARAYSPVKPDWNVRQTYQGRNHDMVHPLKDADAIFVPLKTDDPAILNSLWWELKNTGSTPISNSPPILLSVSFPIPSAAPGYEALEGSELKKVNDSDRDWTISRPTLPSDPEIPRQQGGPWEISRTGNVFLKPGESFQMRFSDLAHKETGIVPVTVSWRGSSTYANGSVAFKISKWPAWPVFVRSEARPVANATRLEVSWQAFGGTVSFPIRGVVTPEKRPPAGTATLELPKDGAPVPVRLRVSAFSDPGFAASEAVYLGAGREAGEAAGPESEAEAEVEFLAGVPGVPAEAGSVEMLEPGEGARTSRASFQLTNLKDGSPEIILGEKNDFTLRAQADEGADFGQLWLNFGSLTDAAEDLTITVEPGGWTAEFDGSLWSLEPAGGGAASLLTLTVKGLQPRAPSATGLELEATWLDQHGNVEGPYSIDVPYKTAGKPAFTGLTVRCYQPEDSMNVRQVVPSRPKSDLLFFHPLKAPHAIFVAARWNEAMITNRVWWELANNHPTESLPNVPLTVSFNVAMGKEDAVEDVTKLQAVNAGWRIHGMKGRWTLTRTNSAVLLAPGERAQFWFPDLFHNTRGIAEVRIGYPESSAFADGVLTFDIAKWPVCPLFVHAGVSPPETRLPAATLSWNVFGGLVETYRRGKAVDGRAHPPAGDAPVPLLELRPHEITPNPCELVCKSFAGGELRLCKDAGSVDYLGLHGLGRMALSFANNNGKVHIWTYGWSYGQRLPNWKWSVVINEAGFQFSAPPDSFTTIPGYQSGTTFYEPLDLSCSWEEVRFDRPSLTYTLINRSEGVEVVYQARSLAASDKLCFLRTLKFRGTGKTKFQMLGSDFILDGNSYVYEAAFAPANPEFWLELILG